MRLATTWLSPVLALAALGGAVFEPAAASTTARESVAASSLDADALLPVTWSLLRFKASKLMLTATAEVELFTEDVAPPPSWNGEPPADRSLPSELHRIELRSKLLKRSSTTQLWLDPSDASAVRRTQIDTSGRHRLKSYRFDRDGVQAHRRVPAGKDQEDLGPEGWSDRSQTFHPFPEKAMGPVIEPTALLYLVSAIPPETLERGVDLLTFAQRELHRVEIRRTGAENVRARFWLEDEESRPPDREISAEIYSVVPTGSADASDFELLGLEGAVEILVDPELRIPIQVRGRLPPVGRVVVRLVSARLADPSI